MFKKDNILKKDSLLEKRKLEEQEELIEYLKEDNDSKKDEIRDLIKEKIGLEEKILSSDLDLSKASAEIEEQEKKIQLLEERIEYLEELIENYRQMPDLKNMIDNLSTLTTPNIDKLAEIMKSNNLESLSEIKETIEDISDSINKNLGMTEALYHYSRHNRPGYRF